MTRFNPDMTLKEAQDILRTLLDEGHKCPCCTQMAKIYRRKVNSTMARTLITMYRAGADAKYVHTPSLPGDTHEASQLAWWGLAIEERVRRPDGGRAGWWHLTSAGVGFVEGRTTVPKYARIYDSRCLGLDGEHVDIRAALGDKFNYDELMAGI
jgi:hypothetical protein